MKDFEKLISGVPGLYCMVVEHDDDCPTLHSQNIKDCICTENQFSFTDETSFIEGVIKQHEINRAARSSAEKAMRRAGGKK